MSSVSSDWIEPYHRHFIPAGIDNSCFGELVPIQKITDSSLLFPMTRTITILPKEIFGKSNFFTCNEEFPDYLDDCNVSSAHAYTAPNKILTFPPDHAAIILDRESGRVRSIIAESAWHSNLYFSKYWRCDRTTGWQWRSDEGWSDPLLVPGQTNYCYHKLGPVYFHWIVDTLSRIWLLKNNSPYDKPDRWVVGQVSRDFQRKTLDLYDIGSDQCQNFPQIRTIIYEDAVIPGFLFSDNLRHKRTDFGSGSWYAGWSIPFIEDLRSRAIHKYVTPQTSGELLYVGRGDAQYRALRNETELMNILDRHGFNAILPGQISFDEQVARFSSAKVIVAIHGAGLTNLIWAPPGCVVIELAATALGDVGYRFLAQMSGHRHVVVSCRAHEHSKGIAFADLEVDIPAMEAALRWVFRL